MKQPLLIIAIFYCFPLISQDKVQSSAYSILLKTLLSHSVKEVAVADIKNDSNIVFLDAREQNEYSVSHIKNAIWVGYDDFDAKRVAHIDKAARIVVYCSVGYRSEKIAEKLKKKGYEDVANLYGGIFEWKNQGMPVHCGQKETNRVHAYDKTWGVWLNKGEKVYK